MIGKLSKTFELWGKFRFLKRPRKDIEARQAKKLRALVAHAYATVPFWRDLFGRHHLRPEEISTVYALAKIPVVSKKDFVGLDRSRTTSDAFDPKTLTLIKTSGSTGEPFAFYADSRYIQKVSLDTLRSKICHGLRPGNRILRLGGDETEPFRRAGFFDVKVFRSWRLSSFTESAEILRVYNAFKPHLVWGFISNLYTFALWLDSQGIGLVWKPRFIVCSAEMVHGFMREKVESAFGAKIVDRYSTAELGVIADECRGFGGYHVYEDSVLAEIQRIGGEPCLIGTNLDNYATPFIRYNTRDVCIPWPEDTARCGCGLSTLKIQSISGRDNDFLVSPDGQFIAPIVLVYLMRSHYPDILQFRFVQETRFTVRLEVVLKNRGKGLPLEALASSIHEITRGLSADIERVDRIAPDPSGKMRIIRCAVAGGPS